MGNNCVHPRPILAVLAATLLALATGAQAHPKLLAANPAPDAIVAKADRIELRFNERLVPAFSGADLVMTAKRGANRPSEMKIAPVTSTIGRDGRSLILAPGKPLEPGTYRVAWHAVSSDTHRIKGTFSFRVR